MSVPGTGEPDPVKFEASLDLEGERRRELRRETLILLRAVVILALVLAGIALRSAALSDTEGPCGPAGGLIPCEPAAVQDERGS